MEIKLTAQPGIYVSILQNIHNLIKSKKGRKGFHFYTEKFSNVAKNGKYI